MNKTTVAYVALVLTTIAWSSSLIFFKLIVDEVGPIVFVALRYTIATPFLLLLTLQQSRGKNIGNIRKNWKVVLIAGLAGPFLSQVLQYIGLGMTTASDALLLLNLTPIFAVIIAAPVLKEKITLDKLLGLLIATIGMTLIVLNTSPDVAIPQLQRIIGDIIVIVSTLFFAINGIAGKIAVKYENAVSVTFYSILFVVPIIWLSAVLLDDVTVLLTMSVESWIAVAWVATVNTVIAFILYYESMNHIEAGRVQIILNLVAVWGVLFSITILHETITLLQVAGGFLTVIGVIIAQMTQIRRKSSKGLKTSEDTIEND
ncbi:MAG: DMT family transporter [Candidatus Thorarchaeota archaeon]